MAKLVDRDDVRVVSADAACASSSSRATKCGSPAQASGSVLSATSRFKRVSARDTPGPCRRPQGPGGSGTGPRRTPGPSGKAASIVASTSSRGRAGGCGRRRPPAPPPCVSGGSGGRSAAAALSRACVGRLGARGSRSVTASNIRIQRSASWASVAPGGHQRRASSSTACEPDVVTARPRTSRPRRRPRRRG